jgi:hypothetical protein
VSLELLYYDPIASKEIRGLDANWKMEWRDFLDASVGRWGGHMATGSLVYLFRCVGLASA